jgi:hypothetical protein
MFMVETLFTADKNFPQGPAGLPYRGKSDGGLVLCIGLSSTGDLFISIIAVEIFF